jgi:phosphoglycolate phosphatase-like HAD superfamily hydrolase
LLTGNIEPAAHLKVESVGLAEFFTLPGAFGDESFDRRDLPAKAAQRINEHLGVRLEPEQFIVIGDTPNDVACARHFGARVIAVATGECTQPTICRPATLMRCYPTFWMSSGYADAGESLMSSCVCLGSPRLKSA